MYDNADGYQIFGRLRILTEFRERNADYIKQPRYHPLVGYTVKLTRVVPVGNLSYRSDLIEFSLI